MFHSFSLRGSGHKDDESEEYHRCEPLILHCSVPYHIIDSCENSRKSQDIIEGDRSTPDLCMFIMCANRLVSIKNVVRSKNAATTYMRQWNLCS